MEKSTLYGIGIFLMIVVGGYLLLGSGEMVTGNVIGMGDGDVQKVILSMKDYNYYPNSVKVKAGSPVEISLDESVYGCFRDFTIREFGIHEYLETPNDKVTFTPTKKGTYTFACSMGMGTGRLVVE